MSQAAVRPAVPLARPNIGPAEVEAVLAVLSTDTLSMGRYTEAFEDAVAQFARRRFAVACSSGTAALHMAVVALGIGEGDEVVTTPFSFVASSNCLLFERATPRFADIEETTLGLDPDAVSAALSPRTRAILAVDVFGQPCRLDDLHAIAERQGLREIEDSCEGLGSRLNGRPLGSFGDAAAFAFYPNKQITTGEGGILLTDDPDVNVIARSLRNQGRDDQGTWLTHVRLGFNYRMDELSAALGLAQLNRMAELREGRARVARAYDAALADEEWVTLPRPAPGADVDWFVYVVRLDPQIDRDRVMADLEARGVSARPYFSPIHLQPFYRRTFGFRPGDFPVTERVAQSTLALPFSSRHSEAEVASVVEALRDCVATQFRV